MRTFQTIPALLVLGLISCALFARPAEAVPVTGNINFLGNVTLDTNNLATATSITEFRADSGTVGGLNVSGTSGSFNLVGIGTFATFTAPYTFNPSSSSPVLWQIGGFSFNLLGSTS